MLIYNLLFLFAAGQDEVGTRSVQGRPLVLIIGHFYYTYDKELGVNAALRG